MLWLIFLLAFITPSLCNCSSRDRLFNVINNCDYNIWVGAWWSKKGSEGIGGDGYLLKPGTQHAHCISAPFSGRFWGRTNCHFNANGKCPGNSACCDSGSCIDSNNKFALKCGQPGVPPVSLAEFTLVEYGTPPYEDFYDVSLVDGANIPVQIMPVKNTYPPDASRHYYCGAPGCTDKTCDASFPLQHCNWNYNGGSYSNLMQMVSPKKCSKTSDCHNSVCSARSHTCGCDSDANCHTGEKCGSSFIAGVGLVTACGNSSGYYSPNFLCALNPNLGEPLGCRKSVSGQGNRQNLYGCTGRNGGSCETKGASSKCCGCPPWDSGCHNTNSEWTRYALPAIKILKEACPTAYSFPYDDSTSTFTCRGMSATNQVGYDITFCPSGSPGARV